MGCGTGKQYSHDFELVHKSPNKKKKKISSTRFESPVYFSTEVSEVSEQECQDRDSFQLGNKIRQLDDDADGLIYLDRISQGSVWFEDLGIGAEDDRSFADGDDRKSLDRLISETFAYNSWIQILFDSFQDGCFRLVCANTNGDTLCILDSDIHENVASVRLRVMQYLGLEEHGTLQLVLPDGKSLSSFDAPACIGDLPVFWLWELKGHPSCFLLGAVSTDVYSE